MILLDALRCRAMEGTIREQPHYVDRWVQVHGWFICPECLWLSIWPRDWPVGCGRPADEPIRYGGMSSWAGLCFTQSGGCMVEVPKLVADAIWSSLLIGGTNSVISLLWDMSPATFGLPTSLEKYKQRRDLHEIVHGKPHAG